MLNSYEIVFNIKHIGSIFPATSLTAVVTTLARFVSKCMASFTPQPVLVSTRQLFVVEFTDIVASWFLLIMLLHICGCKDSSAVCAVRIV